MRDEADEKRSPSGQQDEEILAGGRQSDFINGRYRQHQCAGSDGKDELVERAIERQAVIFVLIYSALDVVIEYFVHLCPQTSTHISAGRFPSACRVLPRHPCVAFATTLMLEAMLLQIKPGTSVGRKL
jgi:hypothetical protein